MGFHVPRITINFDFKEGTSFGELSLACLGYGLHQAWIYSSMFDKSGIFGAAAVEAGPLTDNLSSVYFVSILVYGLLLLLASVLDTRLIRFFHSTGALLGAALLGTAGTVLLLLPPDAGLNVNILQMVSGALTGAGSSMLLIAWGITFARLDSASIIINGALSMAIGFGVYGLVLHQIPFPFGGVTSACIPLAEFALLMLLRRHVSLDFDNRILLFRPLPINHSRFVLRFGLPVFLLGVALGIMRQTSIEHILPGTAFEDQAMLFMTACGATLLIMVTFLALGGDERWHTFFRPLIPFIAVTAVFIPFSATDDTIWSTSVVLVGYMSFEALMWIFFAELAQRFRLSPIFVFGLGRGVMALAALGGSLLPMFAERMAAPAAFGEVGTVLVIIVAMMMAYAMLPDEREMASIVMVGAPHATTNPTTRPPLFVVIEDGSAAGAETATADTGQQVDSLAGNVSRTDETSRACETPASEIAPVEADTEASTAAESSDAACAGSSAPPARPSRIDLSRSIFADAVPVGAAGALETEDAGHRGRFRERCEVVANTYLLSRRENEVMYYLARGYKSSYIQQQLYISEGTAKTHIRHIYRKLNIHSQQELINLIDDVQL
ncbi:LuxR C-terminal-related transcriptional regulator [Adlercreutzia sp. R7]|uniref:LuxR C-terminal-related transcriptional regulator n=1 Tax=Adlercreutzia wanghongyangiae TaxID=3111451 RepID=A0ABU6IEJ7_9ACTN|nr:LuxR C-terminal-related transcriptional regulator [Adlercreutzia sp. R7]